MHSRFRILLLCACCALLAACSTTRQVVSLPPPPSPGEPPGYVGLTANKLRIVFGTPAFVRKDGTGELWRYDAATCKAFFFLYARDAGYEVRHVETLPRGSARMAADPTCLDALRAKASPPVS